MTAVDDWLAYMARRNRSAATLVSYSHTMGTLAAVCDPVTATVADLDAWWVLLDGKSPNTRARMLSTVRSFYAWAVRFDLRPDDPTRRLDAPTVPTGVHRYFPKSDVDKLLATLPPDLCRAVVLGAWAGLRVAETAALMWSDVDVEARRIHVRHGKGDKARTVGASVVLLDALLPDLGGNVVTGKRTAETGQVLQRRLNRAIAAAGVKGTSHQLRHRYATVAHARTGDLLAVSRALGHSTVATTQRYVGATDDALDKIADAVVQ